MRIIIVGAGAVGTYLASRLSNEGQDVVVIESDPQRAAALQATVDALVITGNGASPATLQDAGAPRAQLLIAASNSDGVNVLACHAGHRLGVERTVARVEDPALLPGIEDLGVDVVIDPGERAALEIVELVGHGGVSDLIHFVDGELTIVGGIVRSGSAMLDRDLASLREEHDGFNWAVAAVVRHGETLPVRGDTVIREQDHALLAARTEHLPRVRRLLRPEGRAIERVVVLGATRMAELAIDLLLDNELDVVVVDHDEDRCRLLADNHPKALVIHGSPTDPEVLDDLDVDDTTALAAVSGWDDVNLTACLIGKAMGAATAIARFHRLGFVGLMVGTSIDASVSSRLAAANAILHFVRRGRIHSVATFKDTDSEALDIEVTAGSVAEGCRVMDLDLPRTAVIAGIARDGHVDVPRGSSDIRAGDRLIVLAPPDAIPRIESMCTS